LKADQLVGDRQLLLQASGLGFEFGDAQGARVARRLAPGATGDESFAAAQAQLLAPLRQVRTVQALAPQQRLELAGLGAPVGLLDDRQLVRGREGARLQSPP
jgi:hypothetical protein